MQTVGDVAVASELPAPLHQHHSFCDVVTRNPMSPGRVTRDLLTRGLASRARLSRPFRRYGATVF